MNDKEKILIQQQKDAEVLRILDEILESQKRVLEKIKEILTSN